MVTVEMSTFLVGQDDVLALHRSCQGLAVDGLQRRLAAAVLDLLGQVVGADSSGNNMVGQDLGELVFVLRLQQRLDRTRRQFVEGFVGWSKHGERSGALQQCPTNPAAFTAATRVVWSLELTAFSTMFLVGYMAAPPTIGSEAATAVKATAMANSTNQNVLLHISSSLRAR